MFPKNRGLGGSQRAGLNILEQIKVFCPRWDSNRGRCSPYPSRYTDNAVPDVTLLWRILIMTRPLLPSSIGTHSLVLATVSLSRLRLKCDGTRAEI